MKYTSLIQRALSSCSGVKACIKRPAPLLCLTIGMSVMSAAHSADYVLEEAAELEITTDGAIRWFSRLSLPAGHDTSDKADATLNCQVSNSSNGYNQQLVFRGPDGALTTMTGGQAYSLSGNTSADVPATVSVGLRGARNMSGGIKGGDEPKVQCSLQSNTQGNLSAINAVIDLPAYVRGNDLTLTPWNIALGSYQSVDNINSEPFVLADTSYGSARTFSVQNIAGTPAALCNSVVTLHKGVPVSSSTGPGDTYAYSADDEFNFSLPVSVAKSNPGAFQCAATLMLDIE
jgi:hypothetical protein